MDQWTHPLPEDCLTTTSRKIDSRPLPGDWWDHLGPEFSKNYMEHIRKVYKEDCAKGPVFPPANLIFNAYHLTPLDSVRVVLLGQNPYIYQGQAQGIAFSVPQGLPYPPSLRNIFLELQAEGCGMHPSADLTNWAKQGVFLLNTSLTVCEGNSESHMDIGCQIFTDRTIKVISDTQENVVFCLWGKPAKKKARLIDPSKHLILMTSHPSPLSAHLGFIGSGHFRTINNNLVGIGQQPIDWSK